MYEHEHGYVQCTVQVQVGVSKYVGVSSRYSTVYVSSLQYVLEQGLDTRPSRVSTTDREAERR